ncbi:MAG TPA: GNAT family N-acetyltransferase [Myxococcaceae bacterium]|jgi:GNAT superfamily N-acetyltransferase
MEGSGAGPAVVVRRLCPGDESVLALLAREDPDFDLDGEGSRETPLASREASAFLSNPELLTWAAFAGQEVVGFVFCHVLRMRKEPARELLLYEIGVRSRWRRQGVGRRLVTAMVEWMRAERIVTAWVLAGHEGAARFYEACGFGPGPGPATYLELHL